MRLLGMVSYFAPQPKLINIFILTRACFFLLLLNLAELFASFTTTTTTTTAASNSSILNNTYYNNTLSAADNDGSEYSRAKRSPSPPEYHNRHKLGSACSSIADCPFENAICEEKLRICQCDSQHPATNRLDKCGKGSHLANSCSFDEQCEYHVRNSMCKNGICVCRGTGIAKRLPDGSEKCEGGKLYSDPCVQDEDCAFKLAVCYSAKCECPSDEKATNHIDKCGKPKKVNEECFFNEQCQYTLYDTICINGICQCKSERTAVKNVDGSIKCTAIVEEKPSDITTDPTMIIVLSVMCLMFVIICVVLHLFSKARWRENRTIFNTPNPRLMNVSLIREKKNERRGSKDVTMKGLPSRDASMDSLHQRSPSPESKSAATSRRQSRSATSNDGSARSPTSKSPPEAPYFEVIAIADK